MTVGQLVDIAAQEMYRSPRDGDPLEGILRRPLPGGRHTLGPGRYETLVAVGEREGLPLLTFTSPHGADDVEHVPPAPAYVAMLAAGLRESRGWSDAMVRVYLAGCGGLETALVTRSRRRTGLTPGLGAHGLDPAVCASPPTTRCTTCAPTGARLRAAGLVSRLAPLAPDSGAWPAVVRWGWAH